MALINIDAPDLPCGYKENLRHHIITDEMLLDLLNLCNTLTALLGRERAILAKSAEGTGIVKKPKDVKHAMRRVHSMSQRIIAIVSHYESGQRLLCYTDRRNNSHYTIAHDVGDLTYYEPIPSTKAAKLVDSFCGYETIPFSVIDQNPQMPTNLLYSAEQILARAHALVFDDIIHIETARPSKYQEALKQRDCARSILSKDKHRYRGEKRANHMWLFYLPECVYTKLLLRDLRKTQEETARSGMTMNERAKPSAYLWTPDRETPHITEAMRAEAEQVTKELVPEQIRSDNEILVHTTWSHDAIEWSLAPVRQLFAFSDVLTEEFVESVALDKNGDSYFV